MLIICLPFFLIVIGYKINMPLLYYGAVAFVVFLDIMMSLMRKGKDEDDEN